MLEQILSIEFLSTPGLSSTVFGTLKERSVPIIQLFNPLTDVNYNPSANYWIPAGIGLVPIVLVVLNSLYLEKEKKKV